MKRIGVIFVLLALLAVNLISPAASADTSLLLCRVDIGNPASEEGHNLQGWGPIEPDTHPWPDNGAPWSGLGEGNARVIWTVFGDLPCATLTLNRCVAEGTASFIRFCHLDGIYLHEIAGKWSDDSFTVSVKNCGDPDSAYQQVFIYTAVGRATSTSQWLIHEVYLPETLNLGGFIDVKFCATAPKWEFFGCDLGQVAFDWGELWGTVPEGGNEGLTPGFWKNHLSAWPAAYTPDMNFNTVFGVTNSVGPSLTLIQGLKLGGGKEKALIRHAVAALLNAADPDIDYPLATPVAVIAFVQEAYATGGFSVSETLDGYNNLSES